EISTTETDSPLISSYNTFSNCTGTQIFLGWRTVSTNGTNSPLTSSNTTFTDCRTNSTTNSFFLAWEEIFTNNSESPLTLCNNTLSNCTGMEYLHGWRSVSTNGTNSPVTSSNNTLSNCTGMEYFEGWNIATTGTNSPVTSSNNTVTSCKGATTSIWYVSPDNLILSNNTVSQCESTTGLFQGLTALIHDPYTPIWIISNNQFTNNTGSIGSYGMQIRNQSTALCLTLTDNGIELPINLINTAGTFTLDSRNNTPFPTETGTITPGSCAP
ncbi:MAG: hypothetical protein WCG14_06545, partial [Chlamydiia bacterium]